jgi:hypothetical protein
MVAMSERQFGAWLGRPMDERDIDEMLSTTGYGTLSLARKNEAYAIPVSFGYDGDDRVFLALLETDPPQRKLDFAAACERACLTVTDVRGRFDWESVVVRGSLRSVDPETEKFDSLLTTLDDNAWFSSAFVRDSGIESLSGYVLQADEVTGLQKERRD